MGAGPGPKEPSRRGSGRRPCCASAAPVAALLAVHGPVARLRPSGALLLGSVTARCPRVCAARQPSQWPPQGGEQPAAGHTKSRVAPCHQHPQGTWIWRGEAGRWEQVDRPRYPRGHGWGRSPRVHTAAPNPLGPRASSGHRLDTLGTPGHAADWAPPVGLQPLLVWDSRAAARPLDFLKQSQLQLGDCWEASGLATPPLTRGGSGLVGRQDTEDPTPRCPHTPAEGLKTPPLGGGTMPLSGDRPATLCPETCSRAVSACEPAG